MITHSRIEKTLPITLNFQLKQILTNTTKGQLTPLPPAVQLPTPPSLRLNLPSLPYYLPLTGHHSTTQLSTPTPDPPDLLEPGRWMSVEPRDYAFGVMKNLYQDIDAKTESYTHYASSKTKKKTLKRRKPLKP
jgi:hypothetical protein